MFHTLYFALSNIKSLSASIQRHYIGALTGNRKRKIVKHSADMVM